MRALLMASPRGKMDFGTAWHCLWASIGRIGVQEPIRSAPPACKRPAKPPGTLPPAPPRLAAGGCRVVAASALSNPTEFARAQSHSQRARW